MGELKKACRVMRLYEADIVSAYRLDRTGEGYVRTIYSFFYNLLVRVLFGCRFRDVNFAFKLVRRSVLDKVELHSEGSFIDAELMVSARKMGLNVVQFGVDYFPRTRGVSTLSSPSVIRKILREKMTENAAAFDSVSTAISRDPSHAAGWTPTVWATPPLGGHNDEILAWLKSADRIGRAFAVHGESTAAERMVASLDDGAPLVATWLSCRDRKSVG